VEIAEHIAALRNDGELMAKAIAAAGAQAPVPTCPEWTIRDLTLHQGEVHRWATTMVADKRAEPVGDEIDYIGPLPDDAGLGEWFTEGHARLVDALEAADPSTEIWTFLTAPSGVAFWARRQCHETGIHRADAESATGSITPFPADVAADGIDELLSGFITRRGGRLKSDTPRSLLVHADDTGDDWLVRISEHVDTERGPGTADCTVTGSASDLHLFVWNRRGPEALDVAGDESLLDLWRDSVTIRWGR
jgi:uncharacterized protein (TIGR03083 family)